MAIIITKTMKRNFGNYRIVIRPGCIMDTLTVFKRRPNARLFKYERVASYVLQCIAAEAEKLYNIPMDKPDSLIQLAEFAIKMYETDLDEKTKDYSLANTQANVFENLRHDIDN